MAGKGVIILLHGVPGVGKTSTAGDLGTSPREVETRLQEAFQLAQLWNCVLLLDEADVFLAQRSEHDIQRNAPVSVFLRLLEYYQGILFLTSNRVGVFDEAFKSRIHMALYYPPLDWPGDRTKSIWATHLIKYAKVIFNSQTERDSHFGPVWNGRQIRNAFQSAVALAAHNHRGTDKIRLTRDQFEKVSKVSDQFNDYLWSIHGRTDSEKASTWGVRDDAWNQTGATRNIHGVQNLNKAMTTSNVPKDVWAMGQGLSAAAAAGPSYQISPPQRPLHPHPIMYGQGITGHPLQHGQQMTIPAQSTGFPDVYAQPAPQGQPQYSPLYQQPHLGNYPVTGQAQPTNMPYREMPVSLGQTPYLAQSAHHSQIPSQQGPAALNSNHGNGTLSQVPVQQQSYKTKIAFTTERFSINGWTTIDVGLPLLHLYTYLRGCNPCVGACWPFLLQSCPATIVIQVHDDPYIANPDEIPKTDRYADVPFYGRYLAKPDDFRIDRQHVHSQSPAALQYWASVLDRCDESVRIYPADEGGRDVFALGSIIVKSSHLHSPGESQHVQVDYSYADANEIEAIALAKKVLKDFRVPEIYFAGKVHLLLSSCPYGHGVQFAYSTQINGRQVLVQERLPGARSHVVQDPKILTNGRIPSLEAEILSSNASNDPDMSFMHNDFTESNCIVDNDKITGLFDWEMAGFFGWNTAGQVHRRIRTPQREYFANAKLSEERLQDIMYWNDLYDDGRPEA
ncbi:hypothetical protein V8F33_003406 [Rhypophila sp. PSN 637]